MAADFYLQWFWRLGLLEYENDLAMQSLSGGCICERMKVGSSAVMLPKEMKRGAGEEISEIERENDIR